MALFNPPTSWVHATEICSIPRAETQNGVVYYMIEIKTENCKWTVRHRFNDFKVLHKQLTRHYFVDKKTFPSQRFPTCHSEAFIEKRRSELEMYLQGLLHQFSDHIPLELTGFLHFQHYEVKSITARLAERYFHGGDNLLQDDNYIKFSPLELNAITERLKMAEPTSSYGNPAQDIGHLMAFISQLRRMVIQGSHENYYLSTMIPNTLPFNLVYFKKLESLEIISCGNLRVLLESISPVNNTVKTLIIRDTLQDISSITLCGILHWAPVGFERRVPEWSLVTMLVLSNNSLKNIHSSIKLFPRVSYLDLSYNEIEVIENIDLLPYLDHLDLSHNKISDTTLLHTRIGNISRLILNANRIDDLEGFSRLYSLTELQLGRNQIATLNQVMHISKLPCLEVLKLRDNPICHAMDYRVEVLKKFGERVNYLILDDVQPKQDEIDTVSLLQAIEASKVDPSSNNLHQLIFPATIRPSEVDLSIHVERLCNSSMHPSTTQENFSVECSSTSPLRDFMEIQFANASLESNENSQEATSVSSMQADNIQEIINGVSPSKANIKQV